MADGTKDLVLSVGFDLDRAEERKLKANLDKATGELEKQQREAKQLSQMLDELNKKYAALNEQHEKKRFRKTELEHTYQEQKAKMKAGDSAAAEWMFSGEGTKTKEEIASLSAEMKPLESELDEVNAKIGETEKKLGDVNAKINTSAANVEVARAKVKEAHIPKSVKKSSQEMDRFGKRIGELVKQAFIFGVIAKGLRTMVGYMGELMKSTPEYAEQLSEIKGNLMVTASSLLSAMGPAISWLLSALNQLTQMLAVGVSTMLGQTREEAIEAAKAFDKLTKASKRSTASLDTLHKLGDSGIMTSYEALENIDEDKWAELADTFEGIFRVVRSIGVVLLGWKIASTVLGFFSDVKSFFGANGAETLVLSVGVGFMWDAVHDYNSGKFDWESMLKTALGSFFAVTALTGDPVAGFVASIVVPLSFKISFEIEHGKLGDYFKKEADDLLDDWKNAEQNLGTGGGNKNFIEQFLDGTATTFQSMGNSIKRWWNDIFHPKFDYPSAGSNGEPYNGWGEKSYNGKSAAESAESIAESNENLTDAVTRATAVMTQLAAFSVPHIPKLATGTVIPPNNPYLAVVGEQRSGTNIEAPLETIVEAMRIALRGEDAGARDIEIKLELDGREFGRAVYRANNEETQRVGVRLAKT